MFHMCFGTDFCSQAYLFWVLKVQYSSFQDHCCILYSIVGWNCVIGAWSRIEGTKFEPNPNEPYARLASESLFQKDGRLIASTTVLGKEKT